MKGWGLRAERDWKPHLQEMEERVQIPEAWGNGMLIPHCGSKFPLTARSRQKCQWSHSQSGILTTHTLSHTRMCENMFKSSFGTYGWLNFSSGNTKKHASNVDVRSGFFWSLFWSIMYMCTEVRANYNSYQMLTHTVPPQTTTPPHTHTHGLRNGAHSLVQ